MYGIFINFKKKKSKQNWKIALIVVYINKINNILKTLKIAQTKYRI